MKQHPLSAAFPAMSDSDFDALVDDIKTNGQKEAVIVFDGAVLDGWHRYRACEQAGVKCITAEHDGSDPVAFVLSRNLHRRHLTGSQRAVAIVAATNWRGVGKPANSEPSSELASTATMAKLADVSTRTIEHAKAAERAGLGEAVRDGMMSARTAAQVAAGGPEKAPEPPKQTKEEALLSQLGEMREALNEAADEVQRLAALAGEGGDTGELIKNLQMELRTTKARRDDLMRENAELKKQVRTLEHRLAKVAA
jgi:ParB-like chromosome segregation protein Spo0J